MSFYIIFQTDRYYCIHCGLDPTKPWVNEYEARRHCVNEHGFTTEPLKGEDYVKGYYASNLKARWLSRARHAGNRLQKLLAAPDYSAEDFLIDFPAKGEEPYQLPFQL